MTELALSMIRTSSRPQARQRTATVSHIGGTWRYRLLVWAFRNS